MLLPTLGLQRLLDLTDLALLILLILFLDTLNLLFQSFDLLQQLFILKSQQVLFIKLIPTSLMLFPKTRKLLSNLIQLLRIFLIPLFLKPRNFISPIAIPFLDLQSYQLGNLLLLLTLVEFAAFVFLF